MLLHLFKNNKKNFSFLQILIAIAIIGIALVPAINLFISSTDVISRGSAYLEATIVAQYILDKVKNNTFLFKNINKTLKIPSSEITNIHIPEHFSKKYNGNAEIKIRKYKNYNDLREITVKVSWKEKNLNYYTVVSTLNANMNDIIFRNE